MDFTQSMTRRGCKGGRVKKLLYTSGTFDPTKIFPKEIPTSERIISQSKGIPSPKAHSSPKLKPRPTAKDMFCPERIPIRPHQLLASIKSPNIHKSIKLKIISVTKVDGLVTIIDTKMLKLNLRNK